MIRITVSFYVVVLMSGTSIHAAAATLVENVRGYSMENGELARFSALEYDGGVVTAVYATAAEAALSDASTRIDGRGAMLLPGLIDAHGHIAGLGDALASVDVTATESEAEAVARVVTGAPAGDGWITGGGWNQVLWPGAAFPTRASLDAHFPQRPVVLHRVDRHALWVNSAALAAAGIDDETPDPAGGQIMRDGGGRATGVLIDNAMRLVADAIPPATLESKRVDILRALNHLATLGMTGAHDAGATALEIDAYDSLAAEGALPIRVYAMLKYADAAAAARIPAGPRGDAAGFFSLRSVKISADGALGSRGAALLEEYSDDHGNQGLLLLSEPELRAAMEQSAKAGFQVNVHAIGDRANRLVLNNFARLVEDPAQRALRHRVEHAQVVHPDDLSGFAELPVIASVQPTHATSDKNMAGNRLGEDRLTGAYAWQTLVESGARLAGGSDFPVEPPNPFFGLHAAVTRQDRNGEPLGGWRASEGLSREQALALFTEDAAYAGHAEGSLGRLKPGYAADFILVKEDLFDMPAGDIWKSTVLLTVVAGEVAYENL